MRRGFGLIGLLGTVILLVIVGAIAYNVGWSEGVNTHLPAATQAGDGDLVLIVARTDHNTVVTLVADAGAMLTETIGTCVNIAVAPALGWLAPAWRTRFFQPHTAPTMIATRLFANQLDTGAIQRVDHPGQGFDHAANRTHACFHPLDRWQRNAGQLGQHLLVDAK